MKANTVKNFKWRLDMILSDQDIVYNYKSSAKFMSLKTVLFDDPGLQIAPDATNLSSCHNFFEHYFENIKSET